MAPPHLLLERLHLCPQILNERHRLKTNRRKLSAFFHKISTSTAAFERRRDPPWPLTPLRGHGFVRSGDRVGGFACTANVWSIRSTFLSRGGGSCVHLSGVVEQEMMHGAPPQRLVPQQVNECRPSPCINVYSIEICSQTCKNNNRGSNDFLFKIIYMFNLIIDLSF